LTPLLTVTAGMTAVPDGVRRHEVLLVEDDPGDVALISEAFAAHWLPSTLHTVGDGVEALAFLRREEVFADAPRPDLILLDLNMPRMDGRELLTVVKNDADLRIIPVVVFTTSALPADVTTSYLRHANAYVTKPLDLRELDRAVDRIYSFYGELVRRPS
jgi:two-component system response regulator